MCRMAVLRKKINCRLCLKECEDVFSIFTGNYENSLSELIFKYLFLKVEPNDVYSTSTCKKCSKILTHFHCFTQFVQKSQIKLQKMQMRTKRAGIIKTKEVLESEVETNRKLSENEENIHNEAYNIVIKQEDQGQNLDEIHSNITETKAEFFPSQEDNNDCRIWNKASDKADYYLQDKECNDEFAAKPICANVAQIKSEIESDSNESSNEASISLEVAKKPSENIASSNAPKVCHTFADKLYTEGGYDIHCTEKNCKKTVQEESIPPLDLKKGTCPVCFKVFASNYYMKRHKRRKHDGEQEPIKHRTCHVCSKVYPTVQYMERHMHVHRNVHIHDRTCHICTSVFSSILGMRQHMERQHNGKREALKHRTCHLCSKVFPSIFNLRIHLRRFHETNNEDIQDRTCKICSKVYPSVHNLKVHVRTYHNKKNEDITNRTCHLCSNVYSTVTILKNHMRNKHNKKQAALEYRTCHMCSKIYPTIQHLKDHLRRCHTNDNITDRTCPLCSAVSNNLSNLRHHLLKVHNRARPFACNICDKTFVTRPGLQIHSRNCLPAAKTNDNNLSPALIQNKCLNPPQTQNHYLEESETVEYKSCGICNTVFKTSDNLSNHMKSVHCGLKSFSCKDCGEKFSMRRELRHHYKIKEKSEGSRKAVILSEKQSDKVRVKNLNDLNKTSSFNI